MPEPKATAATSPTNTSSRGVQDIGLTESFEPYESYRLLQVASIAICTENQTGVNRRAKGAP